MPKIEVHDEAVFLALKLSREGFFGSNPQTVLESPVDIVMHTLRYQAVEKEYLDVYRRLQED